MFKLIKSKLLVVFLFVISASTACLSQEKNDKLLVESFEVENVIDSISNNVLVKEINGIKNWKASFQFIDSIQINQITYLSDGLKVKGYIVKPKIVGKYPCIIYNRGGNRDFGSISLIHAAAMIGKLANEGYVVIASQYRGNVGGEGQEEFGGEEVNDVLNLIDVLLEIPEADTSRIGMFGGSRGGMMTYIALTKTNRLKAVAVLAAPSDKYATLKDRPQMENILVELVDGYAENKEAELDKRSAIKWADEFPKDVPILIMHGNSDWRVKSEQSLRLAIELDKHRVPYRLIIFEGADHGLWEHRQEFYEQLFNWFDKYLKNDGTLPDMTFHGR